MILGFLCFHFSGFSFSEIAFFFRMHDAVVLSYVYSNPYLSLVSFVVCTHVERRENAVEPNVLLNEMFTLFCDQSSNSAASRRLAYPRTNTHTHTHVCVVENFARSTRALAYKTQTHLAGIITRHNHMHHEFLCSVCYFFDYSNENGKKVSIEISSEKRV